MSAEAGRSPLLRPTAEPYRPPQRIVGGTHDTVREVPRARSEHRHTRRLRVAAAGALLGLALAFPGACSSPPAVDKYFHRRSPMSALLGFAYSVEIGNWDYAFESLDADSREAVGSAFRLKWGAILEEDPEFGIELREIITEAIRNRGEPRPVPDNPGAARIELLYADPDSAEFDPLIEFDVILVLEGAEWRVALIPTVEKNWRDLLAASAFRP